MPGFPASLPAVFMDLGSAQCRGGSGGAEGPEDGEVASNATINELVYDATAV